MKGEKGNIREGEYSTVPGKFLPDPCALQTKITCRNSFTT